MKKHTLIITQNDNAEELISSLLNKENNLDLERYIPNIDLIREIDAYSKSFDAPKQVIYYLSNRFEKGRDELPEDAEAIINSLGRYSFDSQFKNAKKAAKSWRVTNEAYEIGEKIVDVFRKTGETSIRRALLKRFFIGPVLYTSEIQKLNNVCFVDFYTDYGDAKISLQPFLSDLIDVSIDISTIDVDEVAFL